MATHYVTWLVDSKPCRYEGSRQDVDDLRLFMLRISPLKRDNISETLPMPPAIRAPEELTNG